MSTILIRSINLAIKSIHTINIQSYEYNYENTFRITQVQLITYNTYTISFNEHGQSHT